MITIPKQLQNEEFRFIKVRDDKRPLEKEWQSNNNYKYNDINFVNYLKTANAYGVMGGYGNLVVLDFDDEITQKNFLKNLPPTFTTKSGGRGLLHTYFICIEMFSTKITGKLDIQATGKQVIGPSSQFPGGKEYIITNDIEIASMEREKLEELLDSYIAFLESKKPKKEKKKTSRKHLFKVGKMREHKLTQLMLSEKLPKGGRNDILWFSYKLLARDSGIDFSSDEFRDIVKDVNRLQQDSFETNKPGENYNFNPFTVNDWCEENGYDEIFKIKKKSNKEEDDIIHLSFLHDEDNHKLLEQVYDGIKTQFCVYDIKTSEICYCDEYKYRGRDFEPIKGEEVEKKAILLPSKAEAYNSEAELDKEITDHIYKWLDVDDEHRQFMLWNIKRSYVFDKFSTLNYMSALGDTGMGKSRYLDVNGSLHYKCIFTVGATTPAPIFRMIEKWKGTLCIDEADFKNSDTTEDIIKIINQGFEKGKHIMRCDENDREKIKFFDVYCPKIIGRRKVFTDKATESRCITKIMSGTLRKDIKFTLPPSFWNTALGIRNRLLMWRFKNYMLIDPEAECDVDISRYEPRLQQIVGSFLTLFAKNENELDKFLKIMDNQQANIIDERQNSFAGEIVSAVHRLYVNQKIEDMSAQNIIDEGNLNYRGTPTKPRGLSSHLKALGFEKTIVKKVDDKAKRCIPIDKIHLTHLFERYGLEITENSEEVAKKDEFGLDSGETV